MQTPKVQRKHHEFWPIPITGVHVQCLTGDISIIHINSKVENPYQCPLITLTWDFETKIICGDSLDKYSTFMKTYDLLDCAKYFKICNNLAAGL